MNVLKVIINFIKNIFSRKKKNRDDNYPMW